MSLRSVHRARGARRRAACSLSIAPARRGRRTPVARPRLPGAASASATSPGRPPRSACSATPTRARPPPGLASRQWARAFVIADGAGHRVAFVSAEVDFVTQAVQLEVLRAAARPGTARAYTDQNVVLTATHTHSGPGGFSEYTM